MHRTSLKVDSSKRAARESSCRRSLFTIGITTAEEVPPSIEPRIMPSRAGMLNTKMDIDVMTVTVPTKLNMVNRVPGNIDSKSVEISR